MSTRLPRAPMSRRALRLGSAPSGGAASPNALKLFEKDLKALRSALLVTPDADELEIDAASQSNLHRGLQARLIIPVEESSESISTRVRRRKTEHDAVTDSDFDWLDPVVVCDRKGAGRKLHIKPRLRMKILISLSNETDRAHRVVDLFRRVVFLENEIEVNRLIGASGVDGSAGSSRENGAHTGAREGGTDGRRHRLDGRSFGKFQSFFPVRRGRRRMDEIRFRRSASGSESLPR